jgi:hypothetical protein
MLITVNSSFYALVCRRYSRDIVTFIYYLLSNSGKMAQSQINKIPLGDGLNAFEFLLNPEDRIKSAVAERKDSKPELERLARLYYGEKLINAGGLDYPFVLVGDCDSENVSLVQLAEPYHIPEQFMKFAYGVIKPILEKEVLNTFFSLFGFGRIENPTNGSRISIAGWDVGNNSIKLSGRYTDYYSFMAMDKSKDIPLSRYDKSFNETETLRSYEIVNGLALDPGYSSLPNMLGLGFVITAYGTDGRGYYLFGRRGKNLAVEGGTIGVLGGTPDWGDKDIIKNATTEMKEELLLEPDEFKIHRSYLVKDFIRAPDMIMHINITGPRVEDIVKRCYGNEEVMKEHDRIYAVPVEPEAIRRIAQGRASFDINDSTIVAVHLCSGKK